MTNFWSAILNGAILSAGLCIVVWAALRITPRRVLNASTRHAIWWAVLLATLALPLSRLEFGVARPSASIQTVESGPVLLALDPVSGEIRRAGVPASKVQAAILPLEVPESPWLRRVLLLWIGCSVMLLIRFGIACFAVYRLAARAAEAPAEWDALVSSRRRIRVAVSDEISIPLCAGPFGPTILIPAHLPGQISADDLRQVIQHEAAHLTRWDDCTLALQRLIEALFPLHPVVRFVTRQIDLEREVACDDIVAGMTESARAYAGCLARILPICGGVRAPLPASGIADRHSHISWRIALLVARRPGMPARFLPGRFTMAIVLLGASVAGLAVTPRLISFQTSHSVSPAPARSQPAFVRLATPRQVEIAQTAPVRRKPSVEPAATPTAPPREREFPLYILGPNDLVGVTVMGEKDISNTYTVGPDGMMSMPSIGQFRAAGMPLVELRQLIMVRLEEKIGRPADVSVELLRNNSKRYTVAGAVLRPGPHPLVTATTIPDAVAETGVQKFADTKNILVLRRGQERFTFNYLEILKGEHMEQNIDLRDGDIIIVPGDEEKAR